MKNTTPKTTYVYVSKNIYFDGSSYRVRVRRNNELTSRNFKSKRKATQFRKELTSM